MPPANYIQKLSLILDFNPSWAFGCQGGQTQLHMLGKILSSNLEGEQGMLLMQTALNMSSWAWQERPLDPELIKLIQVLLEAGADLGPISPVVAELTSICQHLPASYNTRLENDPAFLAELFEKLPNFAAKNLIFKRYQAQQALNNDSTLPDLAENLIMALPKDLFGNWIGLAMLELAHKKGQTGLDPKLYKEIWANNFWHTNLTLALYDLFYPLPPLPQATPQPLPPILLYSWNKHDVLAGTLDSLRQSGTADAPVFVLNNGSNDGSIEMLRQKKQNWGTPFTIIDLPSNVGAPAARNWLLAEPEVKKAPWTVFLDDDVLLNPGWLQSLMQVAEANPGFGAVGCRVTDHTPPFGIQAADFHLLNPAEATHSFEDLEEEIFPFCPAMGQTSEAMFAYTRPCASVTGCCHLLNMEAINKAGPFDVRFNPSQFDDLERDLRSSLAGFPTLYHGQVCVRHLQHSSLRQAISLPQQAHIMGNKIKLEFLQDKQKSAKLRNENQERVKNDLLRKAARLQQALGL